MCIRDRAWNNCVAFRLELSFVLEPQPFLNPRPVARLPRMSKRPHDDVDARRRRPRGRRQRPNRRLEQQRRRRRMLRRSRKRIRYWNKSTSAAAGSRIYDAVRRMSKKKNHAARIVVLQVKIFKVPTILIFYVFLILRHNKTDNLFTDDLYLHIPYT
mgnify:CR=1 FL=1